MHKNRALISLKLQTRNSKFAFTSSSFPSLFVSFFFLSFSFSSHESFVESFFPFTSALSRQFFRSYPLYSLSSAHSLLRVLFLFPLLYYSLHPVAPLFILARGKHRDDNGKSKGFKRGGRREKRRKEQKEEKKQRRGETRGKDAREREEEG